MELHIEIGEGGFHQLCSFMWAGNCWIPSQSMDDLEQMMKELVEAASPACGSQDRTRDTRATVCGHVQDSGLHFQSGREDLHLQKQRGVVAGAMEKDSRPGLRRILYFALEVKNWCWGQVVVNMTKGWKTKMFKESPQDEKDGGRDGASILYENGENCEIHLVQDEAPLSELSCC